MLAGRIPIAALSLGTRFSFFYEESYINEITQRNPSPLSLLILGGLNPSVLLLLTFSGLGGRHAVNIRCLPGIL